MAGDEILSDFDRGGDPPTRQPLDEYDRARQALATELLHRYRRLTADAIRGFVPREQHRDYRAGSEHDLMIAVHRLQFDRDRVPPSEFNPAHASDAGLTLHNAIHAVTVGDLLSDEDFAFLTAPLGELLNVDIAARHAELRAADAPPPGPAVPYEAPVAEPLPGHPLWAYTRERLLTLLDAIGRDSGPDVYVVHLHLDDRWQEDVRHAGVEIRWSTAADLADRPALSVRDQVQPLAGG